MESQIDTNTLEPNRIIKEFEKRAKEAEINGKISIPSKTTRLIEKFEKKAQGVDDRKGPNGNSTLISNIKKVFEQDDSEDTVDKPANVIPAGSTNKLIERFQEQPQI